MRKASNFCLHNAGMITTDIMCTNRIVAVAAGGGGGSRTIEKRGQKAHFLVPRTKNKKTWVLGALQLHDAAMPGRAFSVILTNDDVLRCTTPRFRVDHAWGQSTRGSKTRFLHKSLI